MSCGTLAWLSCQLCQTTTLHDRNYCNTCRVFNAFGPSVKVEATLRDFTVRADRAREASRQKAAARNEKRRAQRAANNLARPNNGAKTKLTPAQFEQLNYMRAAGGKWSEIGLAVGLTGNGARAAWRRTHL